MWLPINSRTYLGHIILGFTTTALAALGVDEKIGGAGVQLQLKGLRRGTNANSSKELTKLVNATIQGQVDEAHESLSDGGFVGMDGNVDLGKRRGN